MSDLSGLTWPAILAVGNLILSSAIVITAFSLLAYMLTRNLRSEVALTFSALLACVLIVSAGDVIIPRVPSPDAAWVWMRVQWIGIAMVPAVYLHFSDAVLRTTRHLSRRRRAAVVASYGFSIALVLMALFTDLLVTEGTAMPPIRHLAAGPLYPVFVIYFVATFVYGAYNIIRARRRCLTPAARRRMTYLALSFAAPGLAVFPYLVSSTVSDRVPLVVVLLMAMVANVIVGTMLVVMAYSVAYYGVLAPDRVVKHDLFHYLLRGPVVGIAVIAVMLVVPRVETVIGIPRETALVFAVVGVLVVGQLVVSTAKPWIDRALYRQDQEEISWIQALERRLLTSSDLHQFHTNVLIGLCELLRVESGFVLVQNGEGLRPEAVVGDPEAARAFVGSPEAQQLLAEFTRPGSQHRSRFVAAGDHWASPLYSQDGEALLGMVAVRARTPEVALDPSEAAEAGLLLSRASASLADKHVQEGVFTTLQRILPDLDRIQEWRSDTRYAPLVEGPAPESEPLTLIVPADEGIWQQWVKDALSHFWGGPKLTDSPLLQLHAVRSAIAANDGNVTRALRAVLAEAIERQRPAGERRLTATEWLFYNILDFRFVQGLSVRELARKLAMSESDLYRKQRAAVAEVARTLAEMEAEAAAAENGDGGMPVLQPAERGMVAPVGVEQV
jgi:hypothetical protein